MRAQALTFSLNGQAVSSVATPGERLSETLRERFGAREVKVGCSAGDCGACTVLVDGAAVCACMVPAARVSGREVATVAGLGERGARLQAAFLRHGAAQCGICTPGMLVSAFALLAHDPTPDAAAVEDALGGVLCRCTGYRKIVDAVLAAAGSAEFPEVPAPAPGRACGTRAVRLDGEAKISGDDFGDDVAPGDALCLRVIRSPHHRAAFRLGDLDAWVAAMPGLERVLTARDIPGSNCFGIFPKFADQPVFAERETRFRGEAVAAVVGSREALGSLDLDAFPVEWEELPAVLTPEAAEAPDAPQLHAGRADNLLVRGRVVRGDAEGALADAAAVVSGHYGTAFVEHAYIEPEAGFARRTGDRIEVHACTQAPYLDRDGVAGVLGIPPGQVRIVPTAVGGGFGSKLDISLQPYIALVAWKLGRPVRMAYSRSESMCATTKRHPSEIEVAVAADAEGRLVAMDLTGAFNTGAYASWGPTVADRVPIHASGPYRIPHYRAHSRAVHTHCAPSGAFRGFGVPQAAFAVETALDELAGHCGVDPLEFRLHNALADGDRTVTGQLLESGVGIRACLEALVPHWQRARLAAGEANAAGGRIRRGAGIACAWYGCGNTSVSNPSTIRAGVTPEGRVVLHQGAVEIGQGSNTVISQIFADALGLPLASVCLHTGHTDDTPDAGKTSASRQTYVSGNAALRTGRALRAQILRLGNLPDTAGLSVGEGVIRMQAGSATREVDLAGLAADADGYVLRAEETYDPPTTPCDGNGQGVPYAVYGYAAQIAEVEVDLDLGRVCVLRVTAAHDVGRAINPTLAEGQIHGGIAQGLGMALMEEFVPGRTENLHDYLIPTFGDLPEIETLLVEIPDPHGPFGAKGLGEHALIPTPPAITNAIHHAAGIRIRRLPALPHRVRAAIRAAEQGDGS